MFNLPSFYQAWQPINQKEQELWFAELLLPGYPTLNIRWRYQMIMLYRGNPIPIDI